jgi:hypothetical protein
MKRTLIVGLVLLCVGCGRRQSVTPAGPAPAGNAPADNAPARWVEVASAEGRFRAQMPGPITERNSTMPSAAGQVQDHQRLHEVPGEELSYAINYADFTADQLRRLPLDKVIDAGRDAIVKAHQGQVESEGKIERDGRTGREVVIRVAGRGRFVLHYYPDGARLYTLTLAGLSAARDSREARAFFDSFHFTDTKW